MRRAGLRVSLLVALVSLSACPATAGRLLDRADAHERERDFQRALVGYRDALRRLGDDDSPAARGLRTRALAHLADLCYLDLADLKCAADSYRRLIENYPEAPEIVQARTHLAEMLRDRLSDLPGAIAQYKALATAYPGGSGADDFQYQVAQGYFLLHDYGQSRSEARALLERFPETARGPQARFLIASCYDLDGQRAEAEKAFTDLLARAPPEALAAKARLALAKLLEQGGEQRRALALLDRLPDDPGEAALVREERQRLARALSRERTLSREDVFAEHTHRGPARRGPRAAAAPDKAGVDDAQEDGNE